MTDLEQSLADYFAAYEQYRLDEIVAYFLLPCHIVSDGPEVDLVPLTSEADCGAAVRKVLDWHRALGVVRGRVVQQSVIELSPRLACIDVTVELEDETAEVLYDFRGVYTFVRGPGGWRVAAISHNQIPRLLGRRLAPTTSDPNHPNPSKQRLSGRPA